MSTFAEYQATAADKDLKTQIEGYRGQVHLDLLRTGEYDDQLVADIDNQLAQHAADNGVEIKSFDAKQSDDVGLVNRHSLDTGDTAAGQAALTLKALRDPSIRDGYATRPEEYEAKLDTAQRNYDAAVPQATRDAARRAALDRGDLPFATFKDVAEDGKVTERMELSPTLDGLDDAGLADIFEKNPGLDRNHIGNVRRMLAKPEGFTASIANIGRQQDFTKALGGMLEKKEFGDSASHIITTTAESLSAAIADGAVGNLGPKLDQLDSALRGTALEQQFTKEERLTFLKDYVTRQSTSKVNITDEDLDKNARTLSTGEVVLPTGVFLSKPLFDRTMAETKVIPEAQKELLAKMREEVVTKRAPQAFKTILSRRPEFADDYAEMKKAGKNDMEILDAWTSDPENQSLTYEWVSGIAESLASAVAVPLAAIPAVGFDNEFSKDVIRYFDKSGQERQEFANLIGKDLGVGYDISTTIAPMVADILLTGGVTTVVRSTVGALARAAVKPAVKGFLGAALKAETKGLISDFARGAAAKSITRTAANAGVTIEAGAAKGIVQGLKPTQVMRAVADDVYRHIGNTEINTGLFVSGFTRSAGSAYVQIYDALEKQTNEDGTRKFTDEQIRDTAMKHATIQGVTTAFTTIGFQMIGAGGIERIFSGGLTRKQAQNVFTRLKKDFNQMSPSAVAGVNMESAETMMASLMQKSLAPWWKAGAAGAAGEAPEEAIQSFLADMDTAWATGKKFDVGQSLKSAMYSGMIGGVMGAGANVARETFSTAEAPEATEAAVRRSTLLETARKLDANPNLKATADAVRKLAFDGIPGPAPTQEDVPEGVPAAGTEQAPGGPEVASQPEEVEYFNFVMGEPAAPSDPAAAPVVKSKEELDAELEGIVKRFKARKGPPIVLDPIPLEHPDRIYLDQLPLKHPDRILLDPINVGEVAMYGRGLTDEGGRILLERVQLTRQAGPAAMPPAKMDETALREAGQPTLRDRRNARLKELGQFRSTGKFTRSGLKPGTPAEVRSEIEQLEQENRQKDYATGNPDTPFHWENDSWQVDETRIPEGAEVVETSDGPAVYRRDPSGKVVADGVTVNGAHTYIGESANSFMPSEFAQVPASEAAAALKGARTYESDRIGDLFPALDQKTAEALIAKYPPTPPNDNKQPAAVAASAAAETVTRDASKPEQMSPQEYLASYRAERPNDTSSDEVVLRRQVHAIAAAGLGRRASGEGKVPFNAEAAEALGFKIPEGYVKQGELYIYQPKAATARDTSKAEQMSPAEADAAKMSYPRGRGEDILPSMDQMEGSTPVSERTGGVDSPRYNHALQVATATRSQLPVNAEAVDTYGIKLPEGYVKQGELYVFQPEQPSAPTTPAAEAAGAAAKSPKELKSIKDDLEMSGVAYDGETRYSVQQASDGTFNAERIVGGVRENFVTGIPDIEAAQAAILDSLSGKVSDQAPQAPAPKSDQALKKRTTKSAQTQPISEGKATIFGYDMDTLIAAQRDGRLNKAMPPVDHAKAAEKILADAKKFQIPVAKSVVDSYGLTLPGYVLEGDLYVYQPAVTAEAAPVTPAATPQGTKSQPQAGDTVTFTAPGVFSPTQGVLVESNGKLVPQVGKTKYPNAKIVTTPTRTEISNPEAVIAAADIDPTPAERIVTDVLTDSDTPEAAVREMGPEGEAALDEVINEAAPEVITYRMPLQTKIEIVQGGVSENVATLVAAEGSAGNPADAAPDVPPERAAFWAEVEALNDKPGKLKPKGNETDVVVALGEAFPNTDWGGVSVTYVKSRPDVMIGEGFEINAAYMSVEQAVRYVRKFKAALAADSAAPASTPSPTSAPAAKSGVVRLEEIEQKIKDGTKLTPEERDELGDLQEKFPMQHVVSWDEGGTVKTETFTTGSDAQAFANSLKSRRQGGEKLNGIGVKSSRAVADPTQQSIAATRDQLKQMGAPTKEDTRFTPENSPVTADLAEHGGVEDIRAFLTSVAKTGKPEHRELAKILLKFPGVLVTPVHLNDAAFAGVFVPQTGQILINTARPGPRGGVDTVLHELVHAATQFSIHNPTPEQAIILKRLDGIRRNVAKRAAKSGSKNMAYATSNLDEFFAHFFTSPTFQREVAAMTPKGERNWVEVLIDAVRDLLGMGKVPSGVLKDMIEFTQSAADLKYGRHAMTTDGKVLMLPAHHGTPHKIDVKEGFRTDKIGTGEGAQAYGYGLYFAGDESIAKYYQKVLSGGEYIPIESIRKYFTPGNVVDGYSGKDRVVAFNERDDGDWSVVVERVEQQGGEWVATEPKREHFTRPDINKVKAMGLETKLDGNLYTVELLPEEDEFLDWDKPLSDQSEKVRNAVLRKLGEVYAGTRFESVVPSMVNSPGELIYKKMTEFAGSDSAASKLLSEIGIPGIKLLDANSRFVEFNNPNIHIHPIPGGFEATRMDNGRISNSVLARFDTHEEAMQWLETQPGTEGPKRNYVIFDAKDIVITHENGQPVTVEQATAPAPGPYGTTRMDALMQMPEDVRDTVRFYELTESLGDTPTQADIDSFKSEQPERYAELKAMRERVLKNSRGRNGEGITEAVHGGVDGIEAFDADRIKTQDGGAGFYFSTDVYSGHAENYASQIENGKVYKVFLTHKNPYYSPTPYTSTPSNDKNVWKPTLESIKNLYGLTDKEVELFVDHFDGLTLNVLANPHEFSYRLSTLERRDVFSEFSFKVQAGITTMRKTLQGKYGAQAKLDLIGFLTKHDGIIYRDGSVATVLHPSQIKSIEPLNLSPEGTLIPPSQWGDAESPSILFQPAADEDAPVDDAEYMDLAKDPEKNKSALQRMVDAAARMAGYVTKGFHGTPNGGFVEFNTRKERFSKGDNTVDPNTFLGAHFAEEPEVAQRFVDELYGADKARSPQLYGVYLNLGRPLGGDALVKGDVEATRVKASEAAAVRDTIRTNDRRISQLTDERLRLESRAELSGELPRQDFTNRLDAADLLGVIPLETAILRELGNKPEMVDHPTIKAFQKEVAERQAQLEALAGRQELLDEQAELEGANALLRTTLPTSSQPALNLGQRKDAYLEGDRGLLDEGGLGGFEALTKYSLGRDPREETDPKYLRENRARIGRDMRATFDKLPYDSIIYKNAVEGGVSIIVKDPSQIKSADPVTYDEQGNIIPLSQRFNPQSDSILFQPAAEPSELLTASHDAGIAALDSPTEEETTRLREHHELATSGNVSMRQQASYRVDATALDRLVTYLRAAVKELATSLKASFNMQSAVHLDRLGRELAAAEDGYRVRSGVKAFDPNDAPLMQMSEGNPQDAEYLSAVEAGDMETAQRMVDAAAKAAKIPKNRRVITQAHFFYGKQAERPNHAEKVEEKAAEYIARMSQMYLDSADSDSDLDSYIQFNNPLSFTTAAGDTLTIEFKYVGIESAQELWKVTSTDGREVVQTQISPIDFSEIGSRVPMDPITYDSEGDVVPLSQRFVARVWNETPAFSSLDEDEEYPTAERNAPLFQLSSESTESEFTETNYTEVNIGNKLYDSTEEDLQKKNWFVRMFAQRDDLLRAQSAIKVDREAMVRATSNKINVLAGIFNRSIKKEGPNMDDVRSMAGSTAPLLTPEEEVRLDAEYQARLEAAEAGNNLGEIEAKATRDQSLADARRDHDAAMLSADPGERAEAVTDYEQAVKDAEAEFRRASQAAKEAAEIEDPGVTAAKGTAETKRENARKQRDLSQEQAKQDYDDEVQSPDATTRVAARGKYEARLKAIKQGHDKTISQITKERDDAISLRSPEARKIQAINEANEWLRTAKEQSMLNHADTLRTAQDEAAERLSRESPLTYAAVQNLRKTLDEFQAKLAKEHKESRPGLSLTIDQSNGLYLVRSYEFYRDPQRREKIMSDPLYADLKERLVDLFGKEFARDALAVLKADPANANRPDADLEALARSNVRDLSLAKFEDYLLSRDGPAKMSEYSEGVRSEVERFMKKNNQDPLIAEMLGEIEDPLFNLTNTMESVSHLLFTHRQNVSLAKDGLAAGYLVTEAQLKANPTKYRGWVPLVAKNPNAPAFSPLGGLYSTAEHKKAFDAAFGTGSVRPTDTANEALAVGKKLIMGAAGKSMATMILGNPASYIRNLFGNPFTAASQGVNPFSKKGFKSAMATFDMVRGQGKGDQAFIDKMIALRVLGDGAKIEFMRDFFTQYQENPLTAMAWAAQKGEELSPAAMDKLRKGKGAWDKLTDVLGRSSEFTETFLGPLVFLNELEVQLKAGVPQAEAEQEAARITKKVLPGKTERSQAVTGFGKSGVATLIAPFLGFKSEMIRSVVGTWQVAFEHTLSDNPVLAAHGRRRLAASFAIQGGLVTLLPIALRALADIDDEEDQLFRAALPTYSKNSNFWFFRNKETGAISTWDLTYALPYSITHDWMTQTFHAVTAGRLGDVPSIFGRLFGEELVGEQIVAGKVLDVLRNKDDTSGHQIYREDESTTAKMYKRAEHVIGGAYVPALVKKGDQLIRSFDRPDKEDEPFWYTPLGITVATVAPFKPRSHETEKFVTRALRDVTMASRQQWVITNKLTSPQAMSPGKAAELIKERADAHLKNSTRAYRFMQAAKGFGMSPRQIMRAANEADMSHERAQLALQGFANNKPLPAETLRKIKEIDPRRYAEVVRAMRQQPTRVNLRDR